MPIESVNVDNVQHEESLKKTEIKNQDRIKQKMRFKIATKRPMNAGAAPSSAMVLKRPEYECTEYKILPQVAFVETIAKMVPKYSKNASEESLRRRLMESNDVAYLLNRYTETINIQNDTLKLACTIAVHIAAECIKPIHIDGANTTAQ